MQRDTAAAGQVGCRPGRGAGRGSAQPQPGRGGDLGRRAPPAAARAARRGPGGGGGAGRHAGHPVHQAGRQAVGAERRHRDGRPDHAGGRGHAGQGPGAVRQGQAGPTRPTRPCRRSPPSACTPTWSPSPGRTGGQRREGRLGGHRVPVRPRVAGGQAGRRGRRGRGGRRRGGHGHRPRGVPGRPVRAGRRGDPGGPRGLRRRPTSRSSWRPGSWSPWTTSARASWLAMLSGADFIKTSTGKVLAGRDPAGRRWSCSGAVRDFAAATGRRVGVKVAGGMRTAKDAVRYLVLVKETAGDGLAGPGAVPDRGVQPAQRPAHAAPQAAHRRLPQPRLLLPRLTLRGQERITRRMIAKRIAAATAALSQPEAFDAGPCCYLRLHLDLDARRICAVVSATRSVTAAGTSPSRRAWVVSSSSGTVISHHGPACWHTAV